VEGSDSRLTDSVIACVCFSDLLPHPLSCRAVVRHKKTNNKKRLLGFMIFRDLMNSVVTKIDYR
jgi:hypothetical protein